MLEKTFCNESTLRKISFSTRLWRTSLAFLDYNSFVFLTIKYKKTRDYQDGEMSKNVSGIEGNI